MRGRGHGTSGSLTLPNVHLNDCRLIVKAEAEAGLTGVEVHHNGNSPAVVASDRDADVRATNTTIAADNGVLVEGGASFTGERVRVTGAWHHNPASQLPQVCLEYVTLPSTGADVQRRRQV